MAALKVLVIGPKHVGPDSRGGMASVVTAMRAGDDPRVAITTVATYVDGNAARRCLVGVTGILHSVAIIATRRADVVHVLLAHRGSVVRKAFPLLAARLAGVPAVIHAHSSDFVGWFQEVRPWTRALVRRSLPADRWLVLGDALAADYTQCLQVPADRIRVLRNPVQIPAEVPARTDGGPVRALFLGRMGQRKGTYDLVEALARLTPRVREALAVVAAGDGEVDEVRLAAGRAGVGDILDVRSWAAPAERDALLAASEIFLLTSREEGLPMALLEAMAWGLAPVTTPIGAIPEVVADDVNAVLVPPGDVAALAAALETLVGDPVRRRAIGAAARRRAADFDAGPWFDALVREWLELAAAS